MTIINKIIVVNGLSKAVGNKKNAKVLEIAIVSSECHLDSEASAKQNDMEKRREGGGRGERGRNVCKPFVTYGIIPYGWIIKEIANARTSITLIVCDATAMKSYIISSS